MERVQHNGGVHACYSCFGESRVEYAALSTSDIAMHALLSRGCSYHVGWPKPSTMLHLLVTGSVAES